MKILVVGITPEVSSILDIPTSFASVDEAADEDEALSLLRRSSIYYQAVVAFFPGTSVSFPINLRCLEKKRGVEGKVYRPLVYILSTPELERVKKTVRLLNNGADEVMQAPIFKEELIARLQAIVRRVHGRAENLIRFYGFEILPFEQKLFYKGQKVHLPPMEMQMLSFLALHHGQCVPRELLIDELYGHNDSLLNTKVIDVRKRDIQTKLSKICGQRPIETVYGSGFRLSSEPDLCHRKGKLDVT